MFEIWVDILFFFSLFLNIVRNKKERAKINIFYSDFQIKKKTHNYTQ
jgi:hypothetical protein